MFKGVFRVIGGEFSGVVVDAVPLTDCGVFPGWIPFDCSEVFDFGKIDEALC
jgi:hypothetical protein